MIDHPDDYKFDEKPCVLLVEDDDQLRVYLNHELSKEFKIVEAHNGLIGLETAQGNDCPDLIVTDINMPVMDGLELTRKLKSNSETSHIPIILLTTRSTEHDYIVGLDARADDYITKPFSAKILRRRIRNFIEVRRELQLRYRSQVDMSVIELGREASDKRFLERVVAIIGKNISNPDYSADELADNLGMSKSTLYRKIKPITGQSINIFLRTVRLKHAASMLQKPGVSIGNVASAVGIWDNSYFSKCFREQFGKTPSEYAKSINPDATI